MARLILVRRFLAFQSLLLWQGGFLFYSAVVVPIGTEVLGSAARQGAITGPVTNWLNLFGGVCLALFAWDQAATADPSRRRAAARWWVWAAAVALLGVLLAFHQYLLFFMDPAGRRVVMRRPFRVSHIVYMWASTLHWLCGLGMAGLALAAWRGEDRARPG